jgi:hypothetical protein
VLKKLIIYFRHNLFGEGGSQKALLDWDPNGISRNRNYAGKL